MFDEIRALRQLPLAADLNAIADDEETIAEIAAAVDGLPGDFAERLAQAHEEQALPAFLARALDETTLERLHAEVKQDSSDKTTISVEDGAAGLVVRHHFGRDFEGPLFTLLNRPGLAARIAEVWLTGEDRGANGTRQLVLDKLLADGREFPALRTFSLERTQPKHRNRTIVTLVYGYEEGGALGLLLDRAPQLRRLDAPSAANPRFFARASHPLAELHMAVGYAHESFIANLASSTAFAELHTLEFVDYAETYMDGWQAHRVPREHWDALFTATGHPALRHVTLVGTVLGPEDHEALLATPLGRRLETLTLR